MTTIPAPPFEQMMKRFFGEIERNLDAAEQLCRQGYPKKCPSCAFRNPDRTGDCCIDDIRCSKGRPEEAPYCSPCERTMPECGPCKGPAPREPLTGPEPSPPPCPKCGSLTFRANIDDQDMILCYNDACKWKGPAEIGQCPHGASDADGRYVICQYSNPCEFQQESPSPVTRKIFTCAREAAALATIERYEREDRK